MNQKIQKLLEKAVNTESTSREYALNFYSTEKESASLFCFDTHLLESIIKPGSKVLDVMMARGRHVLHFARKGHNIHGNDLNPHMVKFVSNDLEKEGLKAKLYNLDATNLSKIRNKTFDCVICMYNSLGCIPKSANRQQAMNEFSRVIKPGGLVVVHCYNKEGQVWTISDIWWNLKDKLWRNPELERGDMLYYHSAQLGHSFIHYFSIDEFRNVFRKAGLRVVKEFYIGANQKTTISGPFKRLRTDAFIFVGKKV
jgi:ubiquinone/menaquinone biosynthesis C-methylase UbiE